MLFVQRAAMNLTAKIVLDPFFQQVLRSSIIFRIIQSFSEFLNYSCEISIFADAHPSLDIPSYTSEHFLFGFVANRFDKKHEFTIYWQTSEDVESRPKNFCINRYM